VHLACQSLLMGESDSALVGGVSIQQFAADNSLESVVASVDGYCRAFDQQANGTVFGSGAGVVILKSYVQAKKDRDHIYAVIKGSAINNDGGHKIGFTAPSVEGQASVITTALNSAGIKPQDISYIETHGTGTPLGDPIEIAALNQAFASRSGSSCPIGSVKTNIGHLDVAAGMAGIIKAALILKNKQIPASLNFNHPNSKIEFNKGPFYVCQKLTPWSSSSIGYAGVSSFGIGGANAHVVLSEHKSRDLGNNIDCTEYILPLSAKSDAALQALGILYLKYLESAKNRFRLIDICYSASVGRQHFPKRWAIVASDFEGMIVQLKIFIAAKWKWASK
jgi:acyl transferase domain-containing protein